MMMWPNKKIPVFMVTLPYLDILNLELFQVFWKRYNFHKKNSRKNPIPTLPKFFRPVIQNTLIFLFNYSLDPDQVGQNLGMIWIQSV